MVFDLQNNEIRYIILWWLIFEKKPFQFWLAGNLNSDFWYLITTVMEFICDFIKNLAPLCDATDEHRVVMAFPVVVIYQKGFDDITICGKGNYKSLIFRLKSFYGFYNKNFYTSQRKNLNQVCHLNSWCHLNLLSPSLTTYIHHAIARLSNEMTQIVNAPKTIKRILLHLKIRQFPQKYGLSVLYPIQRFWK